MDKTKGENPKGNPKGGDQSGRVEGEGSYTATRAYNKHLSETIQSGKIDQKAHEARRAVDGPEGDALRRAEAEGKRHARPGDK